VLSLMAPLRSFFERNRERNPRADLHAQSRSRGVFTHQEEVHRGQLIPKVTKAVAEIPGRKERTPSAGEGTRKEKGQRIRLTRARRAGQGEGEGEGGTGVQRGIWLPR